MPRTIPRYRLHSSSGQAVVSIDGKDVYLGKHNSPESRQRYADLVTEYMGRKPTLDGPSSVRLTVARAVDRFWFGHAHRLEYRERHNYQQALKPLVATFGMKPVGEFGPVWFRRVRERFVEIGWSRQHANAQADRLKRFLRWLVGMELFDVAKLHAIREVPRLKPGEAPDSPAVVPVSWAAVETSLSALPEPVRRLVLSIWWSGMRPGEACRMRAEEADRSGRLELPGGEVIEIPGVWSYRPGQHKNSWRRNRPRIVLLGPRAQEAVGLAAVGPVFDPRTVARNPRAGETYTAHSLSTAVARGCDKLAASRWHPNQLRHAAGTRFRAASDREIAATLLGHAGRTVTDRYAVDDWKRAADVAKKVG